MIVVKYGEIKHQHYFICECNTEFRCREDEVDRKKYNNDKEYIKKNCPECNKECVIINEDLIIE